MFLDRAMVRVQRRRNGIGLARMMIALLRVRVSVRVRAHSARNVRYQPVVRPCGADYMGVITYIRKDYQTYMARGSNVGGRSATRFASCSD